MVHIYLYGRIMQQGLHSYFIQFEQVGYFPPALGNDISNRLVDGCLYLVGIIEL